MPRRRGHAVAEPARGSQRLRRAARCRDRGGGAARRCGPGSSRRRAGGARERVLCRCRPALDAAHGRVLPRAESRRCTRAGEHAARAADLPEADDRARPRRLLCGRPRAGGGLRCRGCRVGRALLPHRGPHRTRSRDDRPLRPACDRRARGLALHADRRALRCHGGGAPRARAHGGGRGGTRRRGDALRRGAACGPAALAAAKQLIDDLTAAAIDEHLVEDTAARIAALRASPEGREGVQSVLGRRAPAWRGDREA